MKKFLSAMLAIMLVVSLAACGSKTETTQVSQAQEETGYKAKAVNASIYTGSTGGSWYAAGAAYSEVLQEYLPGSTFTVQVGGGVSNPTLVANGEADIGFTYSPALAEALQGIGNFPNKLSSLRAIGRMEPCYELCFATVASGITSFEDIINKKIPVRLAVPAVGNMGEMGAAAVLEANGLSYKMIESFGGTVQHVSHPEAVDLFRDGHIDMYMCSAGLGHASVTEMCLSRPMKFLAVNDAAAKFLLTKGYEIKDVPTGSFEGITEPVPSALYYAVYLCNDDADEAFVYYATKALNENLDDLAAAYSAIAEVDTANMAECFGCELHKGAKAYYKEVGKIK